MKEIPITEKLLLMDFLRNTSSRKQAKMAVDGKVIKSKIFGKKFKFKHRDGKLFALVKEKLGGNHD